MAARADIAPVLTYTLIALNLAGFALQFMLGISAVSADWGMWPVAIAINGEWWRLLTSAFLHGGVLHILFNMYVLFVIGSAMERILGHSRYIVLYLVAALGGSVTSYLFSDIRTVSVGASGAIFGLMGAFLIAGWRRRYDMRQVIVLLALNVVLGFIFPGIDWRAHLGGLVTGALITAVFTFAPRRGRVVWQIGGVVVVLAALLALAAWRSAQIEGYLSPLGIVAL